MSSAENSSFTAMRNRLKKHATHGEVGVVFFQARQRGADGGGERLGVVNFSPAIASASLPLVGSVGIS